jgi:hypothetical protein
MPTSQPEILSERELSEYARISIPCLKYWRSIGYGPPFIRAKGRVVMYDIRRVMEWIDSCAVEPGEDPEGKRIASDGVYEISIYGGR